MRIRALKWQINIPDKPRRYWVISAFLLVLTSLTNPFLQETPLVKSARYWVFQELSERLTFQSKQTGHVTVVQINDDIFWSGDFEGRSPTNRAAIAAIMLEIAKRQPKGIALDFWMPLPYQNRSSGDWSSSDVGHYELIHPDPEVVQETRTLATVVAAIADRGIKVILPRTIGDQAAFGGDALAIFGICDKVNRKTSTSGQRSQSNPWHHIDLSDFHLSDIAKANISCAHIDLNGDNDLQTIPGPYSEANLNSLAIEIDRLSGNEVPSFDETPLYVQYIDPKSISLPDDDGRKRDERGCDQNSQTPSIVVSASCLFDKSVPFDRTRFNGQFVILGANWTKDTPWRGQGIDLRSTSIGMVNGPLLHQSYAEALINKTYYTTIGDIPYAGMDIAVGIMFICIIVYAKSRSEIIYRSIIFILGLFFIELIILGNSHRYLDMLIPVTGLSLHAVIERLISGGEHSA